MRSLPYRSIECFILFIGIPVGMALPLSFAVKGIGGLMAFVYVLFVLLKIEGVAPKRLRPGVFRGWWRTLALRTSVIGVFALLYVYYTQPDMLFSPLNNAPSTWLKFLVIYTVFSVWPQELVYRTFFYSRYRELFGSEAVFVFLNAVLFALAHLFFRNVFVLLITFAGGLLFAQTYNRYRSTVLVTLEHALYGCWLFTVGLGPTLGFPL